MNFIGDYHTHTKKSDGRQSLRDVVEAARVRGLREVAITDHGPLVLGIGVKRAQTYLETKKEIAAINRELEDQGVDLKVLLGAEANIRDLEGNLDIPGDIVGELDFLIAGLHPYTLPTSVRSGYELTVQNSLRHLGKKQRAQAMDNNTRATVEALYRNPAIDILAHPGLFFAVDIEQVASACLDNDVLFEINCGHSHPPISDIIKAYRAGVNFIVNSDAHFMDTVGQLSYGQEVIDLLGIEAYRVANFQRTGGNQVDRKRNELACAHYYRFVRGGQNPGYKLP